MGISTHVYTVYGVKHPYSSEFSEAQEIDDLYKLTSEVAISDGMGGEYLIIGKILFDSGDARWESLSGFVEIDPANLGLAKEEASAKFIEIMPEFAHLLNAPWRLMTFAHYS